MLWSFLNFSLFIWVWNYMSHIIAVSIFHEEKLEQEFVHSQHAPTALFRFPTSAKIITKMLSKSGSCLSDCSLRMTWVVHMEAFNTSELTVVV